MFQEQSVFEGLSCPRPAHETEGTWAALLVADVRVGDPDGCSHSPSLRHQGFRSPVAPVSVGFGLEALT